MVSNTVKSEILNMSSDDLNELVTHIKWRRQRLGDIASQTLEVGQPVYFTGKRGVTVRGHITRIKRTGRLVVMATTGMQWTVPAHMVKTA